MMKKLRVVLVGAGARGERYTNIMHEMPQQYQVVAVAEPWEDRRKYVQELHGIPEEYCFAHYEDLFRMGKLGDLAIIATQDKMHYDPAMMAIGLGYDLLLEKPISPSPEECMNIARAAKEHNVRVVICTVLRYTPLFRTVKDIIDSGRIGEVISVNHEECVGNVHQSHSFVRGNWGNEGRSANMLLAKSCHDLDLLPWLVGKKCQKIQSFGSLRYFTKEHMPEGAPERCIDGCPHRDTCPYDSVKLYLDDKDNYWFRSTSTMRQNPTDADVEQMLRSKQYGKCVYRCDNDVVDHQTVNMLFEGGATATFTMCAFNRGGRFLHVMGTKGELHATLEHDSRITVYDFLTCQTEEIPLGSMSGHGGGDEGIVRSLYDYLAEGAHLKQIPDISESCHNHMLVFAAEESRHAGTVVDIGEYLATFA